MTPPNTHTHTHTTRTHAHIQFSLYTCTHVIQGDSTSVCDHLVAKDIITYIASINTKKSKHENGASCVSVTIFCCVQPTKAAK